MCVLTVDIDQSLPRRTQLMQGSRSSIDEAARTSTAIYHTAQQTCSAIITLIL